MTSQIRRVEFLYNSLQASFIAAAIAQLLISSNADNIISTIVATLASLALVQYLKVSDCAAKFPLSTLALLGLNLTSLSISLISMTIYWRPLIQDLRAPDLTFPILATVQLLAAASHWIYCNFSFISRIPERISGRLLTPIGLFSTPHISVVWALGMIGAYAQIVGYADTGDVGGKVIQGASFLCWMPFTIPFYYAKFGRDFCNIKLQTTFILAFVALMFIIGLAKNVRQIMLIGPLQIAFAYFIFISQTKEKHKIPSKKVILSTIAGLFLSVHFAADLATAMVVAREKRGVVSELDMIKDTAHILFNERHRIEQYRDGFELAAKSSFYDESYIPNPVLGRLSETKFHDNMIFFGSQLSQNQIEDLKTGMYNKATTILPENITKRLINNYDKNDYIYSAGDYYLYLFTGQSRLSSFVTGSIWADFFTLLKWWYPLICIPYMILMFTIIDSLYSKNERGASLSAVGICTSWIIFMYGIGGESIPSKMSLIFREIPQRILIYITLFWILHTALGFIGIKRPTK